MIEFIKTVIAITMGIIIGIVVSGTIERIGIGQLLKGLFQ